MDLSLTMPVPATRSAEPVFSYSRELDENDLLLLATGVDLTPLSPKIRKLRSSHHQLATLIAAGTPHVEAGAIVGYTKFYVSVLMKDPAFQNLLEYYKGPVKVAEDNTMKKLKLLTDDAVEELLERVNGGAEGEIELTTSEVLKIAEFAADRAGFGAKSTVKHEVGIDITVLEEMRKNADARSRGNVIEATVYTELGGGDGDTTSTEFSIEETEAQLLPTERHFVPEAGGEVS